jgi:hypothetical protein
MGTCPTIRMRDDPIPVARNHGLCGPAYREASCSAAIRVSTDALRASTWFAMREEASMSTDDGQSDRERAEHHAAQAERLLKGKLGMLTSYVKAQAHATLAVYYSAKDRSAT